eukprot:Rmarinus@m.1119
MRAVDSWAEERPTRSLLIRNLDPGTSKWDIENIFSDFGDIQHLGLLADCCGLAFLSYFDVRAARKAVQRMSGALIQGSRIDVQYAFPEEATDPNPQSISNVLVATCVGRKPVRPADIRKYFARFGDIREIRPSTEGPQSYFIEYYDARQCSRARDACGGHAVVAGLRNDVTLAFLSDRPPPLACPKAETKQPEVARNDPRLRGREGAPEVGLRGREGVQEAGLQLERERDQDRERERPLLHERSETLHGPLRREPDHDSRYSPYGPGSPPGRVGETPTSRALSHSSRGGTYSPVDPRGGSVRESSYPTMGSPTRDAAPAHTHMQPHRPPGPHSHLLAHPHVSSSPSRAGAHGFESEHHRSTMGSLGKPDARQPGYPGERDASGRQSGGIDTGSPSRVRSTAWNTPSPTQEVSEDRRVPPSYATHDPRAPAHAGEGRSPLGMYAPPSEPTRQYPHPSDRETSHGLPLHLRGVGPSHVEGSARSAPPPGSRGPQAHSESAPEVDVSVDALMDILQAVGSGASSGATARGPGSGASAGGGGVSGGLSGQRDRAGDGGTHQHEYSSRQNGWGSADAASRWPPSEGHSAASGRGGGVTPSPSQPMHGHLQLVHVGTLPAEDSPRDGIDGRRGGRGGSSAVDPRMAAHTQQHRAPPPHGHQMPQHHAHASRPSQQQQQPESSRQPHAGYQY